MKKKIISFLIISVFFGIIYFILPDSVNAMSGAIYCTVFSKF